MHDIGAGVGAGMKMIRGLSADGHFAINETGGKALIEAFQEMATWVDENLYNLNLLAQEPQLGSSQGASAIKPYVQQVATDKQGFITMLKEFRAAIGDAEQGVLDAMNNYKTIDFGTEKKFKADD